MLHITEETLVYIRREQARAEANERRRNEIAVRKPRRKLDHRQRNRLVEILAPVLRAGAPTKFEFEGACRHGLRVSLIRQGWAWADADTNAAEIVAAALHFVGAKRPVWNEGQVDFTTAHRVERYGCARCGKPIDEDRKGNGTAAKYCSFLCGNAARQAKARSSGERVFLAQRLSELALKSERTIRERSGPCEGCGIPVITRSSGRKFCSYICASRAKRTAPDAPCAICEKVFRARMVKGKRAKFCSKACSDEAMRKPVGSRACGHCGETFVPPRGRRDQPYCSQTCSRSAKQKVRPEETCLTCRSVFIRRRPDRSQTFCSAPCNPRSPQYVGRSQFKCEKVR